LQRIWPELPTSSDCLIEAAKQYGAPGYSGELRGEFSSFQHYLHYRRGLGRFARCKSESAFFCAQAAAPLLRRSNGTIINLRIPEVCWGWPAYLAHSVSKAGVVMLTKVLAKALAPEVRVNAIAPGTITMPGDPPEWETEFIKLAPLRRSGKPSEVADAVLFLVHSKFITGQVLVLDGRPHIVMAGERGPVNRKPLNISQEMFRLIVQRISPRCILFSLSKA